MSAHPDLIAQDAQFSRQVMELAPGVHGAVGFAASNVYMIEGEQALVIIDTTETTKAAEHILAEFRKITTKPVGTIIYTHSHRDHISGASVFAGEDDPQIVASADFASDIMAVDKTKAPTQKIMMARLKRHFGFGLSYPDERVSIGVGPGQRPLEGMGAGFVAPTRLIEEDRLSVSFHGIDLELVKAPGETPDHMVVWLEDRRVLFCGDNYYSAFPNLYAIRGTAYRDFDAWADTMDLLMGFGAQVLATGHTLPVTGADTIRERLADYRDAIRYVVTETARGMNQGLDPVTIAYGMKLPGDLADKPYLKEFYGHVGNASRAYFAGTLGWFDGNPTSLGELPPVEEARRMVALIGGAARVRDAARAALDGDDPQWAMELADRLLAIGEETEAATGIKVDAMRVMADRTPNAPMRNYYLLSAHEMEGKA